MLKKSFRLCVVVSEMPACRWLRISPARAEAAAFFEMSVLVISLFMATMNANPEWLYCATRVWRVRTSTIASVKWRMTASFMLSKSSGAIWRRSWPGPRSLSVSGMTMTCATGATGATAAAGAAVGVAPGVAGGVAGAVPAVLTVAGCAGAAVVFVTGAVCCATAWRAGSLSIEKGSASVPSMIVSLRYACACRRFITETFLSTEIP